LGSEVGGSELPLATLLINLAGAFLLGVLLERLGRARGEPQRRRLVRLLAGTGFLGGFTTYSALGH
jgi:fluoride exporter